MYVFDVQILHKLSSELSILKGNMGTFKTRQTGRQTHTVFFVSICFCSRGHFLNKSNVLRLLTAAIRPTLIQSSLLWSGYYLTKKIIVAIKPVHVISIFHLFIHCSLN